MIYIKRYLVKRRKVNIFFFFLHKHLLNGDESMKKIIPFIKDLNFQTKISDVTSIALEHNLNMENEDSIVGNFVVSGKYKINSVSINEEDFDITIPFDITLDDKYDSTKIQIDIDDFYYEIINEEVLRVHIDVLINNLVYINKKEELRNNEYELCEETLESKNELNMTTNEEKIINDEIRGDVSMTKSAEDVIKQDVTMTKSAEDVIIDNDKYTPENEDEGKITTNELTNNLTNNFLSDEDNYVTYKVHIVRNDQTIEDIISLYNTSKEELEKYNNISDITMGSKIIIPTCNE